MHIVREPLTPQDIHFLKRKYDTIMWRFFLSLLILAAALTFIFFMPLTSGGTANPHTIKMFVYFFIIPTVILYLAVFIYFAPYKIKADLIKKIKKTGVVRVLKVEALNQKARKDFFNTFDHRIVFEKNEFGITDIIFSKKIQPELYTARSYKVEVGAYSKVLLKSEPI